MPAPTLPAGMYVLERGWLSSNNVIFTSSDQTLMVDSGYCTHSAQTLSLVESVLGNRPLDTLLNTHLHSDHCGGNAALQTRYPAMTTLIPPGQAEYVRDWDAVALTYLPTGQLCPRFHFNKTLEPGTTIEFGGTPWEIHAAAGHDPHSVIFFEPVTKTLISADALWENGFGVVFPELEGAAAFSEVGATLDLIESLNARTVVPGHGRVFLYTPAVMRLSRQRLEAFVKNPARHAHHAAKVLLKFKLLEKQTQPFQSFVHWAADTAYLIKIHEKFFPDAKVSEWIAALCEELIAAGAAKRYDADIVNS